MEVFFALVLVGFLVYLFFPRKPNKPEIIVRLDTGTRAPASEEYYKPADDEDRDDYRDFDFYRAVEVPATGSFRIKYKDSRGKITEREITVKRAYDSSGRLAVDAHCSLRNAHRTFVDERVQQAISLSTGEVVPSMVAAAIEEYQRSPKGVIEKAINDDNSGVGILMYIARADSRMNKAERIIIAEYLTSRHPELSAIQEQLDEIIKGLVEPSPKEYKALIKELKNNGEDNHLWALLSYGQRIIGTQKKVDPNEVAAIQHIKNAVEL